MSPSDLPIIGAGAHARFLAAVMTGEDVQAVLASREIQAVLRPEQDAPPLCQFCLLGRCTERVRTQPGHRGAPYKYCGNRDHHPLRFKRDVERLVREAQDIAEVNAPTPGTHIMFSPDEELDWSDPVAELQNDVNRLVGLLPTLAFAVNALNQHAGQANELPRLRAFVRGVHARAEHRVTAANRRTAAEASGRARAELDAAQARAAGDTLRAALATAERELAQTRDASEQQLDAIRTDAQERIAAALSERDHAMRAAQAEAADAREQARAAIAHARDEAARAVRAGEATAAARCETVEQRARADVAAAQVEAVSLVRHAEAKASDAEKETSALRVQIATVASELEREKAAAAAARRDARVAAQQLLIERRFREHAERQLTRPQAETDSAAATLF